MWMLDLNWRYLLRLRLLNGRLRMLQVQWFGHGICCMRGLRHVRFFQVHA